MSKKKKAKQQQPVPKPKTQRKWPSVLACACGILGFVLLIIFMLAGARLFRLPSQLHWPLAIVFSLLIGANVAFGLSRRVIQVGSIGLWGVDLKFPKDGVIGRYVAWGVPILVMAGCLMLSAPKQDVVKELAEALRPTIAASLQGSGGGLGTPMPSEKARELASKIPDNADPYALALKAIAERRFDDARRLLGKAESGRKAGLADVYCARGDTEYYAGRYREAAAYYLKGVRLSSDDPDLLSGAGVSLSCIGRHDEAEKLLNRALAIAERTVGTNDPYVGQILNSLAGVYCRKGDPGRAEQLIRRALAIWEHAPRDNDEYLAVGYVNLGMICQQQRRFEAAETYYARALMAWSRKPRNSPQFEAGLICDLGVLRAAQGSHREAETCYRSALTALEKALGRDHPCVAVVMNNLAALYQDQGRYADAEVEMRQAEAIWAKTQGPDSPEVAKSLDNLGWFCMKQGKYRDAELLIRRGLDIRQRTLGGGHPEVGVSLTTLAGLYYCQGKYGDAERIEKRVLEIFEKSLGPTHQKVGLSMHNYATLLRKMGRRSEAAKLDAQAKAILGRGTRERTAFGG